MMLVDLAVKATVLIGVGFACGAGLRRASAASRHAVWTTVFVMLLLLPAARAVMPEWAVVPMPDFGALATSAAPAASPVAGRTSATVVTGVAGPGGWQSAEILGLAWMAGALLHLIWIGAGLAGTRRLASRARVLDDRRVNARARRVADWLGVRRPIRLLAVPEDVMPVTWGLVAPTVLLPEAARRWTDAQLDAVLTHELSHVERRDVAANLAARVATALWWWHPAMWVAARHARLERERACDDLVLAMGAGASDYAANLVTFVASLRPPSLQTLAMARRSQLEGRVMAILASGVNRRGVSQGGALAAMLVAVLVWPLAAVRPTQAAPQQQIRVGGDIKAPVKTKDVRPVYPAAAIAEGRQGVVIIEAVIGTDGTIGDTKVIRSIGDDLDQAAVDAVSQWEFTPTLLNGAPVPVIITLTVNFKLGEDGQPVPPPPPPAPPAPQTAPAGTAPPPPPPAPEATPDGALRIGGAIKPPLKTKNVNPVYPPEAQDARIQGVVIFELRIDTSGRVAETMLLRGVDGLNDAAREAVEQWEFQPTLLNGVPVPVIMTVTVNFTLR